MTNPRYIMIQVYDFEILQHSNEYRNLDAASPIAGARKTYVALITDFVAFHLIIIESSTKSVAKDFSLEHSYAQ